MKKIKWRYALGEILIVIIGVTIAFSMNKYAENSKDNALKQQYLQSLKNDIESDKLQLQENIKQLTAKLGTIDSIVPHLEPNSTIKPHIGQKIFKASVLVEFNAKDITYSTLVNSGDFKLINDLTLRTVIEEHYSKNYKKLYRDYERMENIQRKYLADYYIDHLNYDDMQSGQSGFENKKRLRSILYSIRGAAYIKIGAAKANIESCKATLAGIEAALKSY